MCFLNCKISICFNTFFTMNYKTFQQMPIKNKHTDGSKKESPIFAKMILA